MHGWLSQMAAVLGNIMGAGGVLPVAKCHDKCHKKLFIHTCVFNMATWPLLTARIHGAVFFAGAGGKGSLEVPQLSADVHLQQHCVKKGKGVCVVGLLDLGRPG